MIEEINNELRTKWNYFLNTFDIFKIETMKKEEYVIGLGSYNKSFCYMVEVELRELGSINGSNSYKFGMYYGKTKKDNEDCYRWVERFGKTEEEAFNRIRIELVKLIKKTKELTVFKDIDSLFSSMFKYKIMYLYNPKIMLPSFNIDDLVYFAECLNIDSNGSFEELQKRFMKYRDDYMPDKDNHSFIAYLYNKYGREISDKEFNINDELDNQLNKSLNTYGKTPNRKEKKLIIQESRSVYARDLNVARLVLARANYKCEIDKSHECFIRRSDGNTYTEVHHLIPMAFQKEFSKSIDIEENIVSLCSSCHNEIHYGKYADELIKDLYYKKINELKEVGINISLKRLLGYYNIINKKH